MIEVLAYLVRNKCESEINAILGHDYSYVFVDYCKPGPDLAYCVSTHSVTVQMLIWFF